jgi:hypothetical protein
MLEREEFLRTASLPITLYSTVHPMTFRWGFVFIN